MKKQFYTIATLLLMATVANAQVGVGTASPDASSMLDVTSTTKGFLMPRMTTANRVAIASPATGLQVYDTTSKSIWYFDGTAWVDSKVSTNIYNSNGSITDAVRTVQLNTNMIQFYTNTAGALVQINDGANGGTALKINAEAGKYGFNQNGNGKFAIDNNGSLGGRVMVLENGNVGLNWNNPSTKLEVRGGGAGFPATTGATQSAGQYARFHDNGNLTLDMGGNGASGNWLQSTDINNLTANYPLLLNPNGGNVGIGQETPVAKLDVLGTVKIADGTQGAGKVLTSDANGLATWSTAASTADGSETKVQAGTNVTITGSGTTAAPYVVNASGGSLTNAGVYATAVAYTLQASDLGKIITSTNTTGTIIITVPNTLAAGFYCEIIQKGAGRVSVVGATGTVVNYPSGGGSLARVKNSAIGVIIDTPRNAFVTGDCAL